MYRFISCTPLTNELLHHDLQFQADVNWVEGPAMNGALTGTITIPQDSDRIALLKRALAPDEAAIYVRYRANNTYPWGGPIVDQQWNTRARTVTITCVDWRSWLSQVFLGPKRIYSVTTGLADVLYSQPGVDQIAIAHQLVRWAQGLDISLDPGATTGPGDGRPNIWTGDYSASGVTRDLNIKGSEFKYVGEVLETMSQRDRGFDWDLIPVQDGGNFGLPRLKFVTYFPQKGSLIKGLEFKHHPTRGTNFTLVDDSVSFSTRDRVSRQWATGATDTVNYAWDSDPDLTKETRILRERVTSYSSVSLRNTLGEHAIAERRYWAAPMNNLRIRTTLNKPSVTTYGKGDRAKLVYQDDWYDLEYPAVRVIERKVSPFAPGGGAVEVTLDLQDYLLPELDEG